VGVAHDSEVGADIEVVRPRRYLDRLANRVLAPDELAQWEALPAERRLEAFLEAWTAKEAYLKAIGRGITVPFHDVPLRPDGWTIAPVAVSGGAAHIAVEGVADVRVRTGSVRVAELQTETRAGARDLRDAVFPCALGRAAHHEQVARLQPERPTVPATSRSHA
jgi:phosphopantetheine--protein transferase-like protein